MVTAINPFRITWLITLATVSMNKAHFAVAKDCRTAQDMVQHWPHLKWHKLSLDMVFLATSVSSKLDEVPLITSVSFASTLRAIFLALIGVGKLNHLCQNKKPVKNNGTFV